MPMGAPQAHEVLRGARPLAAARGRLRNPGAWGRPFDFPLDRLRNPAALGGVFYRLFQGCQGSCLGSC